MKCKYADCNYSHGWTNEPDNKWIDDGVYGDFYKLHLKQGFDDVIATRFHGGKNRVEALGCPKCGRFFLGRVLD